MINAQVRNPPSHYLNPNWCIFCRIHNEDSQHLFMERLFSKHIWNRLSSVPSVSVPNNLEDLLNLFAHIKSCTTKNVLWSNLIGLAYSAYG